ncbi:hypothetical protein SCA6_008698 [Theobroma cacao]
MQPCSPFYLLGADDSLLPESHDKGRSSNFKSKSWQLQLHGSLARDEYVPNSESFLTGGYYYPQKFSTIRAYILV